MTNHMKFLALSIVLLLALKTSTYGQAFTVNGSILDAETGEALAFASVGLRGTNIGTSANLNGEFTLSIAEFKREESL